MFFKVISFAVMILVGVVLIQRSQGPDREEIAEKLVQAYMYVDEGYGPSPIETLDKMGKKEIRVIVELLDDTRAFGSGLAARKSMRELANRYLIHRSKKMGLHVPPQAMKVETAFSKVSATTKKSEADIWEALKKAWGQWYAENKSGM